jgi:hypothetical protein
VTTAPPKPEPTDHIARELLDRVERDDDYVLEFDRHGNILQDRTLETAKRSKPAQST